MNENKTNKQKTFWNWIRTFAAVMLIVGTVMAMVVPVEATTELRITDYNLNMLKYHAVWTPYSYGELMLWPSLLDAKYQYLRMIGTIRAVQVNDMSNLFPGECVSLVKALSKSYVVTSDWERGSKVMSYNLIQPGTVIATFNSNGDYVPGHAAIFRDYAYSNGQRIGILVWDQNYLPDKGKVVARHVIKTTGTTFASNANNYYTVRVP